MQQHRTKQQTVFDHLRHQIMSNALPPGTRLTIRDLAAQMGVSEIPVREALKQLEIEGLIEMTPYTGVQVSRLSHEEMREIAEMREALEPYATGLAAKRIKPEELARLDQCVRDMERATAEGNAEEYTRLNRVFHEIIYDAAGNKQLRTLIFSLWDNVRRNQAVFKKVEGVLDRSLEEHRTICLALKLGDPALATQAMLLHRVNAMTSVKILTEMEDDPVAATIELRI